MNLHAFGSSQTKHYFRRIYRNIFGYFSTLTYIGNLDLKVTLVFLIIAEVANVEANLENYFTIFHNGI